VACQTGKEIGVKGKGSRIKVIGTGERGGVVILIKM
jgi:hypothetical protein